MQVLGLEAESATLLTGKFAPVLVQYQRALRSLDAHPVEQEKAVSEAVGALEAVVRITLGSGATKDFGPNCKLLFRNVEPWTKVLERILGLLQGYRSQLPGAGHGRYTSHNVTDAEVRFVVRTCGSAIAFLIEDDDRGRW
jgi:hypothetical protein